MRSSELKKGHYYQGKNGSVRKYLGRVYYTDHMCHYKGLGDMAESMLIKSFARWAVREVVARWEAV